jgi:hypothetical protein
MGDGRIRGLKAQENIVAVLCGTSEATNQPSDYARLEMTGSE